MAKPKQARFFKTEKSDYGGSLRNTRKGRSHGRPLAVRTTMHLVLRSSKAKGDWAFRVPKNDKNILRIIEKFAAKYGVKVISIANAWNHLHLQIQLSNRYAYAPFIRAITGAIALSVTNRTRWNVDATAAGGKHANATKTNFWDHRPYTRIVNGLKAFFNLKDYIRMNQIEGDGWTRTDARQMVQVEKIFSG